MKGKDSLTNRDVMKTLMRNFVNMEKIQPINFFSYYLQKCFLRSCLKRREKW